MRIFLVRHGMSESNADWDVNRRKADHAIELTEPGRAQARGAGEFLANYFADEAERDRGGAMRPIRLWHSPYTRTRQTADELERACVLAQPRALQRAGVEPVQRAKGESWFLDRKEHFLLHEQQFGIFDGLSDDERAERYPAEWAHYQKCKAFEGKIWARMPMGESRMQVAARMHQAFGTFQRDRQKHGIDTIVVVGHGTTNRAFTMAWMHYTPEWFEREANPKNASIRLIEEGEDRGYIFAGFENPPGYKHGKKS